MSMRTPLAKVRGLGSAKSGTEHFWLQRLTAREPTFDQVEVSIRAIEEVRRREAGDTPAEQAADTKVEVMA